MCVSAVMLACVERISMSHGKCDSRIVRILQDGAVLLIDFHYALIMHLS